MTNTDQETIYYQNNRGIKVTSEYLTTRLKDEALAPIQSVQVGREPLIMAGLIAIGLILFSNRFGELLYWHEQLLLICIGFGIIVAGYSIAALRIGQYAHEKTVLWSSIWTINAVRQAIAKAKRAQRQNIDQIVLLEESSELS